MALCHEWLVDRYGSEKTFELMTEQLPGADLYALTRDPQARFAFDDRRLTTTALDRIGALRERRAIQLPLMPLAWRYASRRRYDLVVTSSHACVKGFGPGRRALHLCYCYTPARYAWMPALDARSRPSRLTAFAAGRLRSWDRASVRWVDEFAAISRAVAARIEAFYDRRARVIHPPVDTDFFVPAPADRRSATALAASRMIAYKRLDLAIRACHRAGCPLTVAGSGPEEHRLRTLAAELGADVRFVISPGNDELRELYRRAGVVVFPAEEDFGIVAVEAQACGSPVVALARGGSLDTVADGTSGALVADQDERLFAEAIGRVLAAEIDRDACRSNAERFSAERFRRDFDDWVEGAAATRGWDRAQIGLATAS